MPCIVDGNYDLNLGTLGKAQREIIEKYAN